MRSLRMARPIGLSPGHGMNWVKLGHAQADIQNK